MAGATQERAGGSFYRQLPHTADFLNAVIPNSNGVLSRFMLLALANGSMAPATNLIFLLLGISRSFSAEAWLRVSWFVAVIGTVVFGIGLVTLIGYLSGLDTAAWWAPSLLRMAVPTASAGLCAWNGPGGSLVSKGRVGSTTVFNRVGGIGQLWIAALAGRVWMRSGQVRMPLLPLCRKPEPDRTRSYRLGLWSITSAAPKQDKELTYSPETGST